MKEDAEFLHALQTPTSFNLFINSLHPKIWEYFKILVSSCRILLREVMSYHSRIQ